MDRDLLEIFKKRFYLGVPLFKIQIPGVQNKTSSCYERERNSVRVQPVGLFFWHNKLKALGMLRYTQTPAHPPVNLALTVSCYWYSKVSDWVFLSKSYKKQSVSKEKTRDIVTVWCWNESYHLVKGGWVQSSDSAGFAENHRCGFQEDSCQKRTWGNNCYLRTEGTCNLRYLKSPVSWLKLPLGCPILLLARIRKNTKQGSYFCQCKIHGQCHKMFPVSPLFPLCF